MTGAVIYLGTYFIFIAIVFLVFALGVFISLVRNIPRVARILIHLIFIIKDYVLIHLNHMLTRAHTAEVEKSIRNGCKKSIYLRVLLLWGGIKLGRPTASDKHQTADELVNKTQDLSKSRKAITSTNLKRAFKIMNELKLFIKEEKKDYLDMKERLGLR